jgi:TetR/AcrR family fatty acid metabolism transcriptional regulator
MTRLATSLKKRALAETFMREAILAAAKKVLATRTYDHASLEQIAQEAQVAKGSIYVYFPSKEALLWEVLKDSLERFIAAGKEAARGQPTPLGKLRALVQAHLEFLAADVEGFKIALAERTNLILNPRGHKIQTLWRMYQEYADWVGAIFQQAGKAKVIRAVPGRRYALLLLDMMLTVMYHRLTLRCTAPLAQEAEEILALFLRGLSVPEQTTPKRPTRAGS